MAGNYYNRNMYLVGDQEGGHKACQRFLEQILASPGSANPEASAALLIAEFGSLPAVLEGSSRRQINAIQDDPAAILALDGFRCAMRHVLTVRLRKQPILSDWRVLLDYLHSDMAALTRERFRVLYLNARNMLIRDEVMSEGSIDHASVHVREVIHRAMDLGSAAIILVHNHPSGDPQPSKSDIEITRALVDVAKRLGIAVHDHLIIGSGGHTSLKARGYF